MAGGRWLENLGLKRKRGLGRVFPFSVKTVSVKHQTQPSQPPELTYIRDQVCLSVCASLSVSLSLSTQKQKKRAGGERSAEEGPAEECPSAPTASRFPSWLVLVTPQAFRGPSWPQDDEGNRKKKKRRTGGGEKKGTL